MNTQAIPTQGPNLDLGDIYYVLFRHKWKILICSVIGFAVALAMYRSQIPPYQSQAKLLVRYILSGTDPTGPTANNAVAKISADSRGVSVMDTETAIVTSGDLARAVATEIGPERLLAQAGGGKELADAVNLIRRNLTVFVAKGSSVIEIVFQHPDADLVQPVLSTIVKHYLRLHVETHRGEGLIGDSLAQEADTLRVRLNQTEDELRRATSQSGVISLESAKEDFANRMIALRREISNYTAELAGRIAVFEAIKKRREGTSEATTEKSSTPSTPSEVEVPLTVLEEHRTLLARLNSVQGLEQQMLLQFAPDSIRVKNIRTQRVEAEAALQKLRDQYPALARVRSTSNSGAPDIEATESTAAWLHITAYQAKIKELNAQLEKVMEEAGSLEKVEGDILELRRRKEVQEANYRYYANTVEQMRISQTLSNGKVSNITTIQSPSPAYRVTINLKKVGVAAVSGIIAGLVWAFLIELFLDRTVRRPTDLQRLLRVPLFLSIPRLKSSAMKKALQSSSALPLAAGEPGTQLATAGIPEESMGGPLRLFHETLRDRLIGYFEGKNLTHKPKLVAVTGLRGAAGVTTTAAGLARSLSETGEGNVLLVDMTVDQGAAHQFTKGRHVCGLDELLEGRSQAHVHENLYVVSETSNSDRLSRSLPQRFSKLVPKLKASDFDYIIFDMPTVSQLSITPRLAGFMDMVLLVIESEKTDREVVQGACSLLAESKASVGLVLNKTRNYVPPRFSQELVG